MIDRDDSDQRLTLICQRYPDYPGEIAAVVRTAKLISRRIHDRANAVLAPLGLSHPEYNILMMLYGTEDYTLTPSTLAAAAGEKSANITRLTDLLHKKGLIDRTPSQTDRRKIAIRMTDQGIATLEAAMPTICEDLGDLAVNLSDKEMHQLQTLQQRFLDELERHPSAGSQDPSLS